MTSLEERSHYEPGLGIAWLRVPVLVFLPLIAAVALAWCLRTAFVSGWYFVILVPGVGGLALGGVLYAAVGWAHCRNRWLAVGVGFIAGAIGYLGHYELCLLDMLPPQLALRPDVLPHYIAFRMQTDVTEDVGKPADPKGEKPFAPLNWFAFIWELGMVIGASAWLAWTRARRAYCQELKRWMRREIALVPAGAGAEFADALHSGRLVEFAAAQRPVSDPQGACRLIVEHTLPSGQSPLNHPVYVSLESPVSTRPWHLHRNMRRILLRQVELRPAEVLALRPLLPKLTQLLAQRHVELRDLPAVVPVAPSAGPPSGEVAQIMPVPEPFRQRVRTRWYAVWVNLVALVTLVYFAGGMALMAGGVWLAAEKAMPVGWFIAALGAASFLWGSYTGLFCMCVPENRWIERRLRQAVAERPDPLVAARDPEAIYVSLIPRESFAKVQLTMSSDLLLLKVNERARQLLMEGDADRYRIPAGAIAGCEAECFFHPIDPQHTKQLWMVRLLVRLDTGQRELLLSADATRWTPTTNAVRRRTAEDLCRRIDGLRAS